jgi:hypothetical protein
VLVGLALGLAVLLAVLARPWLESLTGLSFSLQTFADPYMLAALVGIGLGAAFEELAPGSHTLSAAVGRFLDVGVEGLGDGPEGIGVVEDLHLASLHRPIEPTAFFLLPTLPDTCYLYVEAGEMGQGLAGVEEAWHRFLPNAPLAYEFADQFFAAVYRADRHTASSTSSPVWRFSSRASDSSASLPSLPGSGVTRSVSGRPLGPL